MVILLKMRGNWWWSRECFTCWPSIFQHGDFSSYLPRRVVPSIISSMCTQKRTFDHLINRYGIPADLLMSVLHLCSCEFFLDLWGRSLWGPLFRALWFPVWLRYFVWISPGLWFCDRSKIESKSSRFRCLSPRRLVASNLGRYKAIYPLFVAKLSLFLNYCCEDRAILVLVHISTYHVVIRAIIVTVGFVITHLSILCLPSVTVFIHHIYLFCHIL